MKNKPIYVEIPIDTQIDKLWEASQNPQLHEQWDLRFSSITYLPKMENEPQAFTYKTNIGFGLSIEGWGKSVGTALSKDGELSSSLHFGTEQKTSIIKEGRGYWKYKPEEDRVTFLTEYHYDVNFGAAGSLFDRFIFRPMIGWATALSFDVLKRWLEKGEQPASQYLRFFSSWLIIFLFFFIWLYHGLIPKIFFPHPEEIGMLEDLLGIPYKPAYLLTSIIGIGEVGYGCLLVIVRNKRRLFGLQMIAFPVLATSALFAKPEYLAHPFSPLTFHLALITLSILGFILCKDIPSAKSCRRSRQGA